MKLFLTFLLVLTLTSKHSYADQYDSAKNAVIKATIAYNGWDKDFNAITKELEKNFSKNEKEVASAGYFIVRSIMTQSISIKFTF